jgi:hypothetical protein
MGGANGATGYLKKVAGFLLGEARKEVRDI